MLTSYRHRNIASSFLLVLILLTSSLVAPISAEAFEEPATHESEEPAKVHEDGRYYPGTGSSVSSGYIPLKTQWVDEGFPGRVDALSITNSRSQARSCANAHQEGDSVTVNQGSESTDATVAKIGAGIAVLVEIGVSIPATTLNDISTTWDNTIQPTVTSYFGSVPDIDDTCTVELLILSIDGGGGIGGYFNPSMSSAREIIFMDSEDLSWRNTIISHEFAHLLHSARDPGEYLWIDEGAADMAAYLTFGLTNTLVGHANGWTESSNMSVRWWNQRNGDYGAGFLMMLYVVDTMGGSNAFQRLISDSAKGSQGIVNLALSPEPGATPVGTTFSDIFANFSAAATLDSNQLGLGFSNLDLAFGCSSTICRIQYSGFNDTWSEMARSGVQEIEGWGVRAYRYTGGTGAQLSIRVQPSESGFMGSLLQRDSSTGTWSISNMVVDPTSSDLLGLVQSFGSDIDDVWVIVRFESSIGDCDYAYASCGPLPPEGYPTASMEVFAQLITDPAEISISESATFDRDGDGNDDSVEMEYQVLSQAFYERVDVLIESIDSEGQVVSSSTNRMIAGNSDPVEGRFWFTPPSDGDWTFRLSLIDGEGSEVDQVLGYQEGLWNMMPTASGSSSTIDTQPWLQIAFFGSGTDEWGIGLQNGTYSNIEPPAAYAWDFGDGSSSTLKNPYHSYTENGNYTVTLLVTDQGQGNSDIVTWDIFVNDSSDPLPEISVEGLSIGEGITLLTGQRVAFSSRQTEDNVPLDLLWFEWNWGDGQVESGVGLTETSHSWNDGDSDGTVYTLSLTVDDGIHRVSSDYLITILNRAPSVILDQPLQTFTLTPMILPDVFEDVDGAIVSWSWSFETGIEGDGVNIGGSSLSLGSDFTQTSSDLSNPRVAWKTPGMKNVTVEVEDNDGNRTAHTFNVLVLNQRPLAVLSRPVDGESGQEYIFDATSSYDPDGFATDLSFRWTIDGETIENISTVFYTFEEPGTYSVSLVVSDDLGEESGVKTYTIEISNPQPIPKIEARIATDGDDSIPEPVSTDDPAVVWMVPHTTAGGIFLAPGQPLFLDGGSSIDGDAEFENGTSTDRESPEWTGIVDWYWDFGDGSPVQEGATAWHSWSQPGDYTVTLTVRDSFLTGDVQSTTILVTVSEAPVIPAQSIVNTDQITVGDSVEISATFFDPDLESGIVAWLDKDAFVDSDGDGSVSNDRQWLLTGSLESFWDTDILLDEDGDGDPSNDFEWTEASWSEIGERQVLLRVCDGVDICVDRIFIVTVYTDQKSDTPKSLGELTLEDFRPSDENIGLLALVSLLAVLWWMILRQKDDEEMEAEEFDQTFDVPEVKREGGLQGMDQHIAPPQPKYLTIEDRRDEESGYIRPVRSRR